MPVELPPKKEVATALLQQSTVFIHLDPRAEDVIVPPWFKKQPRLVLQVGLNMPVPIPDLHLDDEGVSCTLSFNRSPCFCRIPWKAVFALISEDRRGMVWPDDVPREVAVQVQGPARQELEKARAAKRAHLRSVPTGPDANGSAEPSEPSAAPEAQWATEPRPAKPAQQSAKTAAAKKSKVGPGAKRQRAAAKKEPAKKKPAKKPAAAKKTSPKAERTSSAKKKTSSRTPGAAPAARRSKQPKPKKELPRPAASRGDASASRGKPTKRKLPPYLRVVK